MIQRSVNKRKKNDKTTHTKNEWQSLRLVYSFCRSCLSCSCFTCLIHNTMSVWSIVIDRWYVPTYHYYHAFTADYQTTRISPEPTASLASGQSSCFFFFVDSPTPCVASFSLRGLVLFSFALVVTMVHYLFSHNNWNSEPKWLTVVTVVDASSFLGGRILATPCTPARAILDLFDHGKNAK